MSDFTPGSKITGVSFEPTSVDLFKFSAASWLLHRIHYDRPFALGEEGHPELLVHGPLQGVYIVRTLESWIGSRARLASISYRHLAPAYLGEALECGGTVTSEDSEGIEVEVFVRKHGGEDTTKGVARLLWQR